MPRSVCVAYLYNTQVEGMFTDSLVRLLLWDGQGRRLIVDSIGARGTSRVALTRNAIVTQFMANPDMGEWLWMIDTDMVFQPWALERLVAITHVVDRPVVGGLCFKGSYGVPIEPTLYDDDGKVMTDWPRGEMVKVGATGAACLLVHRSVFERLAAPWFVERDGLGEDLGFCARLRGAGIPIWVHTGIRIGHVKSWVLDEAMYDATIPVSP